ncbi:MAG: hypothetical protein KA007_03115 [Candidatus Pacebacteria bacterium]|nr:hypothetical protein [Candidatus Paceibacterota bacterium]
MEKLQIQSENEGLLLEDLEMHEGLSNFLINTLHIKSLYEVAEKTEIEFSLLCGLEYKLYLKEIKNILEKNNLSFKSENN